MSVKLKKLYAKNFAAFDEVTVDYDPNVTYLAGTNGAGKSTLGLNAIHAAFTGISEKASKERDVLIGERFRFIGQNGKTSSIEITLFDTKLDCEIKVLRKITKDANFLEFQAPEGVDLTQGYLDDIFSVFMINPHKFIRLSPKEQALALGIDTTEFDQSIKAKRSEVSVKQGQLKSLKESIDNLFPNKPESVPERIDVDAMRKELSESKIFNDKANADYHAAKENLQREVLIFNNKQEAAKNEIDRVQKEIEDLETRLKEKRSLLDRLPKPEPKKEVPEVQPPMLINTAGLEAEINQAIEHNASLVKFEQYESLLIQASTVESSISVLAAEGKKLVSDRLLYIQSHQLPSSDMTISEDGELLVKGKLLQEQYFSTGEIYRNAILILSSLEKEFKYVFLQHMNDLDDENRDLLVNWLVKNDFQVVAEIVSKEKVSGKNSILLKGCRVVDSYDEKPSTDKLPL